MSLMFAKPGQQHKVVSLEVESNIKRHLSEIGFNIGTSVTVLASLNAGVIVKVKNARIAIDRNVASKIIV